MNLLYYLMLRRARLPLLRSCRTFSSLSAQKKPYGYWNSIENQHKFLQNFIEKNRLDTDAKSWRTITKTHFCAAGGRGLIEKYHSLESLLKTHYPSVKWGEILANWDDRVYQRKFLDSFAISRKITSPQQWRQITVSEMIEYGAKPLLQRYKSFSKCLKVLYPEYSWDIIDYTSHTMTRNYWNNILNQRRFMEHVKSSLEIQNPSDWNKVTKRDIIDLGGRQIFKIYTRVYDTLRNVFPEITWNLFVIPHHCPPELWKDSRQQLLYLKELSISLDVSPIDLTTTQIQAHSSTMLFSAIGNTSLSTYLRIMFPELTSERKSWKDITKQRELMKTLSCKFNIQSPEDWRHIRYDDIKKAGGSGMLYYYPKYRDLFAAIYPETDWEAIFNPPLTVADQIRILKRIADEKDIEGSSGWNRLTLKVFNSMGGKKILDKYNSYFDMLCTLFPDIPWNPFEFHSHKLPKGFWKERENQIEFIKYSEEKLHIRSPEDWNRVSSHDVIMIGGRYMIRKFGSVNKILEEFYPDKDWNEILTNFPKNHWNSVENQRQFFDTLMKKLELNSLGDLLSISTSTIASHGGQQLLRRSNSYYALLQELYPEYSWHIASSKPLPRNYLKEKEHQRDLLAFIGKKHFNITKLDDWCSVSSAEFQEKGGKTLLRYYSSFLDMLRFLYPNHKWDFVTKDRKLPPFYWSDFNNVKQFMEKARVHYNITEYEDWYRISISQIISLGGGGLLLKYKFFDVLTRVYPDFDWKEELVVKKDKRSKQRWLCLLVKQMFPNDEVIEEFTFDTIRESGRSIEIDVYVPRYRLGLEYNGEHHYKEVPAFGSMEMYRTRDLEKISLCKSNDISVVSIPYWWDDTLNSLCGYIDAVHPSLLFQHADKNLWKDMNSHSYYENQ